MAAGPAIEMWSKQTGNASSPDGKQRIIKMQRGFTVTLDPSDPLEIVYLSAGLPLVNDLYPGTLFVICRDLDPVRIAPALALVVVSYSGEIGTGGVGSSPISNETIITWRGQVSDEAIDEDINGKAIVNVNGERIEGITERVPDLVATIEKNFASINLPAISAYLRSRNSDTFLGFQAGTARLWEYSASNIITDGVAGFWKVSATVVFREPYNTTPAKCWYKRVLHEGFKVRLTAGGEVWPAFNLATKTIETQKPILLKADGTRETDPDNAHWLEFETTLELPYAALGLL
jgi:hypothetical protein